jgi:hypothetical protein
VAMLEPDMQRFVCQSCGVKWFVPPHSPMPTPEDCAACGGALAPLDDESGADDQSLDRP